MPEGQRVEHQDNRVQEMRSETIRAWYMKIQEQFLGQVYTPSEAGYQKPKHLPRSKPAPGMQSPQRRKHEKHKVAHSKRRMRNASDS